ncbi:MAG: hypothetical protein IKE43_05350 [Coriobacteriales bacterium]|nr:hypothetical protein [Coriobacteriales bacterium]
MDMQETGQAEEPLTEEELVSELAESGMARGGLYRLIGIFLASSPNANMIEALAQAIIDSANIEDELMADGFKDMARYLETDLTNSTVLDLLVDYRLSVGKIEPFKEDDPLGTPQEQMGALCESLCTLCSRMSETLQSNDYAEALKLANVQSDLYKDRVVPLFTTFCDVLDAKAQTLFYRGTSKVARSFMQEEQMYIEDTIAAIQELIDAQE